MSGKTGQEIQGNTTPVAIIGMACRFPGAATVDEFWTLLVGRGDGVRDYPTGRSPAMDSYYAATGKSGGPRTRRCGTLPNVKEFDAEFFGISPREAALIDPQQRLLLELGWEALEDAGVPRERFAGSDTGVYAGVWLLDYLRLMHGGEGATVLGQNGGGQYSTSGRLAFLLDLRGPDVAVNLGCASGLAAVHLACEALRAGECGMALAGAANAILDPDATAAFTKGGVLSPDGRCKFGDASADGFVRSEGAGVFVLKLLTKAVEEGDRVYAVIRGSAIVNNGAGSGSLTTPGGIGQAEVLRKACIAARISPAQLAYVEAHGTGTGVGDPVEISALAEVVGRAAARGAACIIGSVKTNIGHTESASGIAGMMKTVLALRHRFIPASLHVREPNPKIDWATSGLKLELTGSRWPETRGLKLAGVSSFGLTGTNVHLVLEEAPAVDIAMTEMDAWILPITAPSYAALRQLARSWVTRLRQGVELRDLCFTASLYRTMLGHRLCAKGANAERLADSIEDWLDGHTSAAESLDSSQFRNVQHTDSQPPGPGTVFVFPGQGAQWAAMGQELNRSQPVFRDAMERCDAAIQVETGWSLLARLYSDEAAAALNDVSFVQPALFAISVALAKLWTSWGVLPAAVAGHSMGEVAAAHIAGALSLRDAAAVICRRSRLLKRVSGRGAMALLELTMSEAAAELAATGSKVSIAASNGQRATVISGDFNGVMDLVARLEGKDVFCRVIKVDVASHSPQMDPLLAELEAALGDIHPQKATVPIFSTVLGRVITGEEMDASYWVRNLREPVLFHPVIQELLQGGVDTFLEMSPHPTLAAYIEQAAEGSKSNAVACSSLRRQEPELAAMFGSLSLLFERGAAVDWRALYPAGNRVALPPFPWQRQTFWLEEASRPLVYEATAGTSLLGQSSSDAAGGTVWMNTDLAHQSWLRDHVVGASVLIAASVYVHLALEAGTQAAQGKICQVEQLFLREAVFVPPENAVELQTLVTEAPFGGHLVRFFVRTVAGQARTQWTLTATASIVTEQGDSQQDEDRRIDPDQLCDVLSGNASIGAQQHHEAMAARGYNFGPSFLCIDSYVMQDSEAIARARLPAGLETPSAGLHPVLLDAGLQVLASLCYARGSWKGQLLPVRFACVQTNAPATKAEVVLIKASLPDANKLAGDLLFYTERGELAAKITGALFKSVERDESLAAGGLVYAVEWESAPSGQAAAALQIHSWLICEDAGGIGAVLTSALRTRGNSVEVIPAATMVTQDEVNAALARLRSNQPVGVVYLRGCDLSSDSQADEAAHICAGIAHLVRVLAKTDVEARLSLITQSAEAVPGDRSGISIAQAAIAGLAAVIVNEHPELRCRSIDLGPENQLFVQALGSHLEEARVAVRGERVWVPRLKAMTAEAPQKTSRRVVAGEVFRLEQRLSGHLDSLRLVDAPGRDPGALEVEIRVHAAGLSFRDVMQAMGLMEDPSGGSFSMGFEAAGVVTRVGAQVRTLQAGDPILAVSAGNASGTLFASHAVVPAELAVPKPESLTMAEAAALPGAYLTAFYGLVRLANLKRSEKVLIHAAAGGVGLAAIQIAKWRGAEIFATAGSEVKREYLRQLGIVHVMDSRGSGFGRYIHEATGGKGVDVVLNSLAGEAVAEGMRALAPYGRFVEVGKRDMWRDSAMGMSAFMRNRSVMGLDLATMVEDRPETVAGMLREITSLVAGGALSTLPVKIFPASHTAEAFRYMAEARQTGKVVFDMNDPDVEVESTPIGVTADATYLITGGMGALGLESARELVELGARHLILTSRSEPSSGGLLQIAGMQTKGAEVRVRQADVSYPEQLQQLLDEVSKTMPPLRGIIHAAGVLEDALVEDLDLARFELAMAGKSTGAILLDRMTREIPLDFFVLYSSIAGLLGSPGQGNYASANAMLDAVAHDRARRGLPATSINWGPWSKVGLAARESNRGDRLAGRGLPPISPVEARRLLRQVLLSPPGPQVVLGRVDRAAWMTHVPAAADSRFLAHLALEKNRKADPAHDARLRERLRRMSAEDGLEALINHLREQTATVLRMKPEQVPLNKPLRTLGIDSLMGVELRQRLEKTLELRLSSAVIWNYPTIAELGQHLEQMLQVTRESAPAGIASETDGQPGAMNDREAERTAMALLAKEMMEAEDLLGRT